MLLHLYTGVLPWSENDLNHNSLFIIKKTVNYTEFYRNLNKYDRIVKKLIDIYNAIHTHYYYSNIIKICNQI